MERIAEWLRKCGKRIPESFEMPSDKDKKLALGLLMEEVMELAEAWGMDDHLPHMALVMSGRYQSNQEYPEKPNRGEEAAKDALVDIYVVLGNAVAFSGYAEGFNEGLEKVMASNESKIYPFSYQNGTEEQKAEVDARVQEYAKEGVKAIIADTSESTCVLLREHDLKILKPGKGRYFNPKM